MITYNASDIIKRALQLADLENSDFLSFQEKIALLNESYSSLYQKLINKGDNSFLRIINTTSNVIELPPDFYQLKSITLNNNGILTQVLQRPANQTLNYLSYDMINNVIQINGNTFGSTVCIEYYPVPTTLTFPNESVDLSELPSLDGYIDSYDDLYLTYEEVLVGELLADRYVIRSFRQANYMKIISNIASRTGSSTDYYEYYMDSNWIVFANDTSYKLVNTNTGLVETILYSDNTHPLVYKNKLFLYDYTAKKVLSGNKTVLTDIDIPVDSSTRLVILSDNLDSWLVIYDDGGITKAYYNDIDNIVNEDIGKIHVYYNRIYMFNGTENFSVLYMDSGIVDDILLDHTTINAIGFDDNTGYGFIGMRHGTYYKFSYYEDTELNYPNNMYFTVLGYVLALAFKTKQGSDTTQLSALATESVDTFFDSLTRDDWGMVRITNSY